MSDLLQLLAGSPLALHRAALPGLLGAAALRVGDAKEITKARARFSAAAWDTRRAATFERVGTIALIPISGVITTDPFLAWVFGGTSPDTLTGALRAAAQDAEISKIILVVNSPGGGVELLTETAAEIRRIAQVKSVVAIARTFAASAAYWLASQASELIASPSAALGSVGVCCIHYDCSKLNERVGIAPTYIHAGKFKVEGNPDHPLSAETAEFMQAEVNKILDTFVADVARGRRTTPATVRKTFGEGRVYNAADSLARGMVDRVEDFSVLLARMNGTSQTRARAGTFDAQMQADLDAIAITLALTD